MPYKIKHRGSGFKVTTPNHPQGFSKHPMSKNKAVAQLRAIKMNTNEAQFPGGPQPKEAWGFEKRKCTRCGEEKGGSPYRLCKCQREERGTDDKQPHLKECAERIVDALIEPNQSELPMPYSGDPTTLSRTPGHRDTSMPGTPWDRIVQRARERQQAQAERDTEDSERSKYQTAMKTRPKAIYFSGAGYSGAGMHATGGGGGTGLAVG